MGYQVLKRDAGCIYSWCPDIEQSALDQMDLICGLRFVEHAALMPDAHMGDIMPIGGVVACDNVVVPKFVGSDISCGMAAMRISLRVNEISVEVRKQIHRMIEKTIPVGFKHNPEDRRSIIERQHSSQLLCMKNTVRFARPVIDGKEFAAQLGTLGGG